MENWNFVHTGISGLLKAGPQRAALAWGSLAAALMMPLIAAGKPAQAVRCEAVSPVPGGSLAFEPVPPPVAATSYGNARFLAHARGGPEVDAELSARHVPIILLDPSWSVISSRPGTFCPDRG